MDVSREIAEHQHKLFTEFIRLIDLYNKNTVLGWRILSIHAKGYVEGEVRIYFNKHDNELTDIKYIDFDSIREAMMVLRAYMVSRRYIEED